MYISQVLDSIVSDSEPYNIFLEHSITELDLRVGTALSPPIRILNYSFCVLTLVVPGFQVIH